MSRRGTAGREKPLTNTGTVSVNVLTTMMPARLLLERQEAAGTHPPLNHSSSVIVIIVLWSFHHHASSVIASSSPHHRWHCPTISSSPSPPSSIVSTASTRPVIITSSWHRGIAASRHHCSRHRGIAALYPWHHSYVTLIFVQSGWQVTLRLSPLPCTWFFSTTPFFGLRVLQI